MRWYTCSSCESEFRIVSDSHEHIDFCPFCGSTIEEESEDLDLDLYE